MIQKASSGKILILFVLAGAAFSGCDDPRSASDQLDPWVDKTVTLAPQGPREQGQALIFTTNLEFVVVKKLETPRTVCNSASGTGDTETVTTEVPEENCTVQPDGSGRCKGTDKTQESETEVKVPGETQTICEQQDKMDVPRVSRVTAIVKSARPGAKLDPGSVRELVVGFHANSALKQALARRDYELAALGRVPRDDGAPRPPAFEKLHPDDDTLVTLKASGLRLKNLTVKLGTGARFRPGDDITIEAVVDPTLGSATSTLGAQVTLPEFRSEEEPSS